MACGCIKNGEKSTRNARPHRQELFELQRCKEYGNFYFEGPKGLASLTLETTAKPFRLSKSFVKYGNPGAKRTRGGEKSPREGPRLKMGGYQFFAVEAQGLFRTGRGAYERKKITECDIKGFATKQRWERTLRSKATVNAIQAVRSRGGRVPSGKNVDEILLKIRTGAQVRALDGSI